MLSGTVRALLIAAAILVVAIIVTNGCVAPAVGGPAAQVRPSDLDFYRPSTTTTPYPRSRATRVRNVIFCIGDGMGPNQVALASRTATGPGGKLHMERMPAAGLAHTRAANTSVPDSAAAATALATGVKTKNGMIATAPNGRACRTILEAAQAKGMATGLVVTSRITHATPACFAAHVKSRKMEAAIAEQLIANRVNVLFGGGRKFFLPRSARHSARKDNKNLIAEAKEAGYMYVETDRTLRAMHHPYMLGLFQFDGLTTEAPEPSLATLTRKAIQVLQGPTGRAADRRPGFFLMVEGSQIDWACHRKDAKGAIRQTLLFDQAVQAAIDFALHDGRTLVIVTADHETGGLTLVDRGKSGAGPRARFSTRGHTSAPVPVWALGPGAPLFAGAQDNTDIPKKIAQLLGIQPFPQPMK